MYLSEFSLNEHCRTRDMVAWSCSSVISDEEDTVRCLEVSFLVSVSSTWRKGSFDKSILWITKQRFKVPNDVTHWPHF